MRVTSLLLFLLFLSLPCVSAVGFANLPKQREFLFTPGGKIDVPIYVIGDDQIDITLSTPNEAHPETKGTWEDDNILDYVTIEDQSPGGGPREAALHIALPDQLRPGIHLIDVLAKEHPEDVGATVSAVASVRLRITIRVLSPEKYVEVLSIGTPSIAQGLQANATVTVVSRTVQQIDNLLISVNVYDGDELVASSLPLSRSLASAETISETLLLPTQALEGGDYIVNASVTYDGIDAVSPQTVLKIGTLHVSIPSHTRELTFNTTNKFTFEVANEWNQQLREVYASATINKQTKKTASLDIDAFGKTTYELYFDRDESLAPGKAIANVTVFYRDYSPESGGYVDKEEEFLLPIAVSLPPVEEKPALSLQLLILYGVIGILLVLILIILFLFLRRKSSQEHPAAVAQPQPAIEQSAGEQRAP